jgi:bla regulator protein blaR1
MEWLWIVLAATWKGAVVLALAFAFNACARHASAAVRHLVWSAALGGVLALPLLSLLLPAWEPFVPGSAAPAVAEAAPSGALPVPAPKAPPRWPLVAAGVWLAGIAVFSARLAYGYGRVYAGIRDAETIRDPQWADLRDEVAVRLGLWQRVGLMRARVSVVPMTWGVRWPVVLLPASTGDWTLERRRAVLMHEMAHIRRKDFLAQLIGQAACALYWFNPLVWMAVRRLALERERACDDRVLEAGMRPSDYAGHLVGIARSFQVREEWAMAAITMASRSQFEGRLRAVLDGRMSRRTLGPAGAALAALALMACLLPLASANSRSYSVRGMVFDPSGARVPRALVTLRNLGAGGAESVLSGAIGEYAFTGLRAGTYALEVRSAGFVVSRRQFVAHNAAGLSMNVSLQFGTRRESLEVRSRTD